jgi:FMN phosphatase YigB (HAD superfamily)
VTIIEDHGIVYFDCDGTLIRPADESETNTVTFRAGDKLVHFAPIQAHINSLILHKARGHTVVVWSHGKAPWARQVVEALDLLQYVDLVISKPDWTYDDEPAERFIDRVIFHAEEDAE